MRIPWTYPIVSLALLVPTSGLALAYQSKPDVTKPLVGVTTNATLGKILVNNIAVTSVNSMKYAKGFTLYHQSKENTGKFACTGACMDLFPPLLLPKGMTLPRGTKAVTDKLGLVKRNLGAVTGKQVTYDGWPLYFYQLDKKPGDTKGNGFTSPGLWQVVPPAPMVTFTIKISPDATWGVASLKYTYHHTTHTSSCSKNSCVVTVHAGVKVSLSETANSPSTWPFSGWKTLAIDGGNRSSSSKSSISLTANDNYDVTAKYVFK
ncbi:MAG TPA: hypothetical protein VG815_05960 [Chloroflexota bacterium]|jgi:predicted lipoprotein with Yx(FWY)xxD motif|nr:hypothetical protein [Chloroflexota bacterium]